MKNMILMYLLAILGSLPASAGQEKITLQNATYEGMVTLDKTEFANLIFASMVIEPFDVYSTEKVVVKVNSGTIEISFPKQGVNGGLMSLLNADAIRLQLVGDELFAQNQEGKKIKAGSCKFDEISKYCSLMELISAEATAEDPAKQTMELVWLNDGGLGLSFQNDNRTVFSGKIAQIPSKK